MKNFESSKRKREALRSQRAAKNAQGVVTQATLEEKEAHDFRIAGAGLDGSLQTVFHVREAQYEVDKRIRRAHEPISRVEVICIFLAPFSAIFAHRCISFPLHHFSVSLRHSSAVLTSFRCLLQFSPRENLSITSRNLIWSSLNMCTLSVGSARSTQNIRHLD